MTHKMNYFVCYCLNILKLTQPQGIAHEPSANVRKLKAGVGRASVLPVAFCIFVEGSPLQLHVLDVATMLAIGDAAANIHIV
jgi:hypothetical protein